MKKVLSLILFLAVVSGVSGLILGGVNSFTAPIIAANSNSELNGYLAEYYPGASFEDVSNGLTSDTILAVYKADDQGYAYELTGNGFGGTIRILVAFDANGTIIGMSALEQSETAGLGQENFTEESYNNLYGGKTIDETVGMRTGSTVTSTAIRDMVSAAQASLKNVIGG